MDEPSRGLKRVTISPARPLFAPLLVRSRSSPHFKLRALQFFSSSRFLLPPGMHLRCSISLICTRRSVSVSQAKSNNFFPLLNFDSTLPSFRSSLLLCFQVFIHISICMRYKSERDRENQTASGPSGHGAQTICHSTHLDPAATATAASVVSSTRDAGAMEMLLPTATRLYRVKLNIPKKVLRVKHT